jgi:hypothetical protein
MDNYAPKTVIFTTVPERKKLWIRQDMGVFQNMLDAAREKNGDVPVEYYWAGHWLRASFHHVQIIGYEEYS